MARAELQAVIDFVKLLVPHADWFADDEIQDILDLNRERLDFEPLKSVPFEQASGFVYKTWNLPTFLESPLFYDKDRAAVSVSGETLDILAGRLIFSADRGDSVLYVSGYEHDPYEAAAEMYERRAATQVEKVSTFSGVAGSFTRATTKESLQAQADRMRLKSKSRDKVSPSFQTVDLFREDGC